MDRFYGIALVFISSGEMLLGQEFGLCKYTPMDPLGPLTILAMASSKIVAIAPPCATPGHPDRPPPIHTAATISLVSGFQNARCTPNPRVPLMVPSKLPLPSCPVSCAIPTSIHPLSYTFLFPGPSRLNDCFRNDCTISSLSMSWPRDSRISSSSCDPGMGNPKGAAKLRAANPVVMPRARTPPYQM